MDTQLERQENVRWITELLGVVRAIEVGWAEKASIERPFYASLAAEMKPWRKRAYVLWVFIGVLLFAGRLNTHAEILLLIVMAFGAAVGIAVVRLFNQVIVPKTNAKRAEKNRAIYEQMRSASKVVDANLDHYGQVYSSQFAHRFPNDYAYSDAIEFCLRVIQNHRANTVGEALNLYERVLHEQRLEQSQAELLEEAQRLRRQHAVGMVINTVMQGAMMGTIRAEGAATRSANYGNTNRIIDEMRR